MMEDQDDHIPHDQFPQDEQAIRDRIDDEITNHELMEHSAATSGEVLN
jgi:hypothetical protein